MRSPSPAWPRAGRGAAVLAFALAVLSLSCRTGPSEQASAASAPVPADMRGADAPAGAAAGAGESKDMRAGTGERAAAPAGPGEPAAGEAGAARAGTGPSADERGDRVAGTGDLDATQAAGDPPPPGAPEPIACLDPPPAGMACVPAGWFVRGSDSGPDNARPQARVWLQTYYLDLHEVTYAEYKACVKARGCDPKGGPAYTDFDRPRQPINGVSWFHADGYCRAQGKRLPSEAQWEKGARGPDGELHPWGDAPATCERAILKDASGRGCGVKKQGSKPETGRPWEIGSRAPGRYGLYDMSGNSWEWVADWYSKSYAECGADCEGVDPLGPCSERERPGQPGKVASACPGRLRKIVRGGSWYWDASYATGVWRRPHYPANQPFHHFGFRCAASPAEAAALPRAAAG